jgi:imidazolonepropionase-like amidohydrolase
MPRRTRRALALLTLAALPAALSARQAPRALVLDDVRIVDGTGRRPIERGRVVVEGDRIVAVGAADAVPLPAGAERVDLAGRTVTPGLIDLHFHIGGDPKLALRQLSHGVTAFREPGQWEEQFAGLRATIAADGLPGPRIFTAGPHIDGERPAYPADSVVARDATEARWLADRSITQGASAIKIYFRLPLASALAVIDVCKARGVPSTAHLEILDARLLFEAGLNGIEHITSLGTSLLPRVQAEAYRQAVLADNNARRDGRYRMFAEADLDGPEAGALYAVIGRHRPWIDATLAVFEQREGKMPKGTKPDMARQRVAGFAKMMQLTRRVAREGGRVVMGGHSVVPFAGRGEAPWREMELLVESGLTPLDAITAATGTAAAFLYKDREFGTLVPGLLADIAVFRDDPSASISAIRSVERVMVGGRWVDVGRYRQY